MKIFYSWQSDTPRKIGKNFIRRALDKATEELAADYELNDAERPHVDQDTQGILGSPSITETIFRKIRASKIVVADVTLVGRVSSNKKLINSNVAIELGYALGADSEESLLTIINKHYGIPDELPFDLKHRRFPISYKLSPDASDPEVERELDRLTKSLTTVLEQYLTSSIQIQSKQEKASTINKASFWEEGDLLFDSPTRGHSQGIQIRYPKDLPLVYLKIWPTNYLTEFTGVQIADQSMCGIEPLMSSQNGYSSRRNSYGCITYDSPASDETYNITQVFKDRQIWGVNANVLSHKYNEHQFIPMGTFERGLMQSAHTYLSKAADTFGYDGKIHIEFGAVNIAGYKISNHATNGVYGEIFEDICIESAVVSDDKSTWNKAILKFFEGVFDSAGKERPEGLHGFP